MTLKECYEKFGGDYNTVLQRLMMDKLVDKFIKKFLDDPSYNQLMDALNKENYEDAFRACHTLKGVCLNLCLNGLLAPAQELTEDLRGGVKPKNPQLIQEVTKQYTLTINTIKEYAGL